MSVSGPLDDQLETGKSERLESCNVSLRLPIILSAGTTLLLVALIVVISRLLL